ncbi:nucleotide exchange factor SIL1 isoform X3 [Nelusetta ayraudi]
MRAPPSCSSASTLLLLLLLLLLLQGCHTVVSIKPDTSVIVVNNPEGAGGGAAAAADSDEAVEVSVEEEEEEEGELEVVQPSEEWQTLRPDQAVPAGSHVRLNLQTGQREVRLGEEQLKYWTHTHREAEGLQASFSPEELKRAMKKLKEDSKSVSRDQQQESLSSKFRPMEELKKDMAELDLLVETDLQILRRLLQQLNATGVTVEQQLNILLELEYLVHQVDNAQTLCSMGGLHLILQGLNSSDVRVQENSAFVLGSALASNPVVQVKAVDDGALQMLLRILASTQPLRVKKKVLFALASLLRHFPHAQHHFLSHGGLHLLSQLFRADGFGTLRTRIVTMLYDMISEKELMTQAGLEATLDASHQERLRQYAQLSLQGELLERGWCGLVPELLEASEHDYREKALRALLAMAPVCLTQFRSDGSLLDSLLALRDQYQDMVQSEMILGEESGYFSEMLELVNALRLKMK